LYISIEISSVVAVVFVAVNGKLAACQARIPPSKLTTFLNPFLSIISLADALLLPERQYT